MVWPEKVQFCSASQKDTVLAAKSERPRFDVDVYNENRSFHGI